MRTRYLQSGNWYKGSLHLHTTVSDGHLSPAAVIEKYCDQQYDFIAITDHWHISDTENQTNGFTLLDGIELDGYDEQGIYHHVVVIGNVGNLPVSSQQFPNEREM